MSDERILDVSELAPPEPMQRILETVKELAPGQRLRVLHRREPFPLYPMLAEMGFEHRVEPGARTEFEIVIWRSEPT